MIRQFNKRILNPAMLRFAGRRRSPYATVRHVGRRSGRAYATPVVARRVEGGLVIPLPYGEDADWASNVRAQGGCTIEWEGETYEVVEPRVTDASEAISAFPLFQRVSFRLFRIHKFLMVKSAAAATREGADQNE